MKKSESKAILNYINVLIDKTESKRKEIFESGTAWYTEYAYYTGKLRAYENLKEDIEKGIV